MRRLWLWWLLANAVGESIGLGGSFLIGALLFAGGGEPAGLAGALLTAAPGCWPPRPARRVRGCWA